MLHGARSAVVHIWQSIEVLNSALLLNVDGERAESLLELSNLLARQLKVIVNLLGSLCLPLVLALENGVVFLQRLLRRS